MSEHEFWKDIGTISEAIINYQKKNAEFNDRFIKPWLGLGNLMDQGNRNDEIAQAYKHATQIDPDNVQNWIDLGDVHSRAGAYEEARIAYQKAIDLAPHAGQPLSSLAYTLSLQGKYEDAIPLYLAGIDLLNETKEKVTSLNRLGEAYRKLNDYEKAFLSFQEADLLDSGKAGTKDHSQDSSIKISEEKIMAVDAQQAKGQDDNEDPLTSFETILSQDNIPNTEAVLSVTASPIQEVTQEDVNEIKILAQESEAIEAPATVEVKVEEILPNWLSEDHKNQLASPADEPKNSRIPEWLVINKNESEIRAASNDADKVKAEVLADQFNGQSDTDIKTREVDFSAETVNMKYSANDTSKNQTGEMAYEEYLKDVVEPVNILSDHVEEVQQQTAQIKLSKSGEELLEMETKSAQVWNELGNVYFKSGSYDEAIAAYSKAIELERQFAWPYSNLALAYVQKGFLAEAILLYQRSIELFALDREKALTWNRLGNVYRRMNDYSNAIAAYQTADELDPENAKQSLRSSFGLLGNLHAEQKSNHVS